MAFSGVNDSGREMMAALRTWYEDAEWIKWGDTTAYVSSTQFKIAGSDVTSRYSVGRRVRVSGSSTGTIYGIITVSAFSTDTTVTVSFDSGSMSNETLTVSLSLIKGGTSSQSIDITSLDNVGTMASQNASAVAITGGTATFNNTGFKILDTNASHALGVVPGSNLTDNRTLTLTTGDADRTVTLSADLTVSATATVSGTNTGDVAAATQAEMKAASSTTAPVTPGRQHHHPGAIKAWVRFYHNAGVPTIISSYNVSSLSDDGTGQVGVNFTTAFSNTNYAMVPGALHVSPNFFLACLHGDVALTTSKATILIYLITVGVSDVPLPGITVSFFGDQ